MTTHPDPALNDPPIPETDDIDRVTPLHGADRAGLGADGWAEVPDDRIGGHPDLEPARRQGAHGGVNGDPDTDRETR